MGSIMRNTCIILVLALLVLGFTSGLAGAECASNPDADCVKTVEPAVLHLPSGAGTANLVIDAKNIICKYTIAEDELWLYVYSP